MNEKEKVLCVTSEHVKSVLNQTGLIIQNAEQIAKDIFDGYDKKVSWEAVTQGYYPVITEKNKIGYVERGECEYSNLYKQIIPYGVIAFSDSNKKEIAAYWRSSNTGDKRLKGKCSIGFGGHVNLEDFKNSDGCPSYDVAECLLRELKEEVTGFSRKNFDYDFVGILNDESSEVNSRHIGLVFIVYPKYRDIKSNEESIGRLKVFPVNSLNVYLSEMETWSQIVCKKILNKEIDLREE